VSSPTPGAWVTRFAIVVAAGIALSSHAMADDALDARLKSLESQLRCLVCQNQTLAESEAPLAADLRKEVRELAVAGKSDDDIRAYLVARYGDFVLYKPPLEPITWLLWFGPFALLAAAAATWFRVLRGRTREATPADISQYDTAAGPSLARARELLDE
jgi:cytochrome c-type biogenesis protein CcmH